MEVVFPTAMGFPFIYTLETPTLVNLGLHLTGDVASLMGSHSDDLNVNGNYNIL